MLTVVRFLQQFYIWQKTGYGIRVEFVLAPQHETSCDPETTTKEDFDYWRKIFEESNLEVSRRIYDKSNEAGN